MPTGSTDVIINEGIPSPIVSTTDAIVNSITFNGDSSVEVASGGKLEITKDNTTLNPKISGEGTLVLSSGKTYTIPVGQTFEINIENNGTLIPSADGIVTFGKNFINYISSI